jgi:hypothetical protein
MITGYQAFVLERLDASRDRTTRKADALAKIDIGQTRVTGEFENQHVIETVEPIRHYDRFRHYFVRICDFLIQNQHNL